MLRRLRLPLPVAPRTCACRGRLDPLGDHRAACATSGVLASRALPLERAAARVCQEAGARVARNVRLAEMNIDVPVADDRRIDVVANGLALWHGSQQAVDATIVSPVTRLVTLNRVRTCTLAAPSTAPRGANAVRRTLSSSAPAAAWLLSVLKSAADLARRQPPGSACSLDNGPWRYLRHYERQRVQLGLPAGLA